MLTRISAAEGLTLTEDVLIYLAAKSNLSERELEGLLIRLVVWSSLTQCEISLEMAQDLIEPVVS
jgi:chromosomal replication initiator protein